MQEERKKAMQSLKTAKGQVEGIIKMIEDDRYCVDISNQIMAAQSLLKKANLIILKNHLHHCVKDACNTGDAEVKIEEIINILEKEGFIQYEFSNFSKEGYFSQNNTAYWFGKPYMGIGPSSHSFSGTKRSWNIAHNIKYIQQIQQGILPQEVEILTPDNRYNELIITRIRTMVGIDLEEVNNVFGKEYQQYLLTQAKKYISKGLLCIKENHLKVTKEGKFLSDGIASDLFRVDDLI